MAKLIEVICFRMEVIAKQETGDKRLLTLRFADPGLEWNPPSLDRLVKPDEFYDVVVGEVIGVTHYSEGGPWPRNYYLSLEELNRKNEYGVGLGFVKNPKSHHDVNMKYFI